MATPPDRYPLHDTSDSNSANLPTAYSLNGFLPFSQGDSRAVNKLLQSNGGWVKFNDFTLVRSSDVNSSTTAYRLSSANLAYTTGAGLGPFSPTAYTAVYVYRGNVIRFSSSFCVDGGIDPITFTASMRTWIYCNENGVVRIDIVALATAAAPAAGEFTVIAVDTDATNITAIETGSSPAFELHFTGPAFVVESAFGVLSNAFFGGDVAVIGEVSVGGNTTFDLNVTINGDLDMGSNNIVNTALVSCSTVVTASDVTIGGSLDMTLGVIDNVTDLFCVGVTASGAIAASGAISGLTLTTTGAIQCGGNLDMTSGQIVNATTITCTTLDTVDSAGIVKVGELQFYSDASPSTTTGVLQYFGRGLSVGISSTAKRIAIPFDNYVATLALTGSSTATGASVSVTLLIGDVVYVTASADLRSDTIGTSIVFDITVDGVAQNSPGGLRADATGVSITCNRTVKYTALATAVHVFGQRYGALLGNCQGTNGFISVRQGN
jgi:hypothetical protein